MKLRGLELEQFRKFDQPVRLVGLSDGINVLCGPNEYGKSTVLAAIRAVLFERHNSRARPIELMKNWRGNAAPRVAMEFEIGAGAFRIEKRFVHQPMARLTAPDGSRFDGDAAEEELQRLLGFGAAGKTGAKIEQMGVWGALWVTQRESVQQADLSSDLARATIAGCLDAEVGVLTGSEKGQAIIRMVREALGQLQDGNRKPRGRAKEVLALLADAEKRLAELRGRAERLTEDADALRRADARLTREADPAAEQHDLDALDDARRRKETALLAEERLQAARSALKLAEASQADALREVTARARQARDLGTIETRLQAVAATAREAGAAAVATASALLEARAALEVAREAEATARAGGHHAGLLATAMQEAASLAVLDRAVARAEAAQAAFDVLAARRDAIPITAKAIAAIRKAANELAKARGALDAVAPQVGFDLLPEAAGKVTLAGGVVPAAGTVAAVEDIEITIADIGRITVRPRIKDREILLKQQRKAEDALRTALAPTGCDGPDAAEHLADARELLAAEAEEAKQELARLAPGAAATELAPGAAALRAHADALRQRAAQSLAATGLAGLPTPEAAAAAMQVAQKARQAAEQALADSRIALEAAQAQDADARVAAERAVGDVTRLQADRDRLQGDAAAAQSREADAALAVRLQAGEALSIATGAELAAQERAAPRDTADAMQARIERYEKALAQRHGTVRQLREEIVGLRTRIAQEGGHGLDEQLAAAERAQAALQQERDQQVGETEMLTLLLDTLGEAEREAKERYLAPVLRRVTPYLRSLFPGADIACDEAFRVTGLTRGGQRAEDFERLSDGTQEQIAVLARLAFAEMLVDQGKPAMVILDDALAYSDAERMERMFDILTQAARRMQVLILSCREDLFARIGGHRVSLARMDATATLGS